MPVDLRAQAGAVHQRHPLDALSEHPGQPAEDAAADLDVVRGRAADVDGRHRRASAISSATSVGSRPSVSTVSVATDS